MYIFEVNPSTLKGSIGPGLVPSKFWLLTELSKIKDNFDSIYILGSWYGALGAMLAIDPRISYKKLINVETNSRYLRTGQQLIAKAGDPNTVPMLKDANKLDYRQLGVDGLVINTSCGNIKGTDWFQNIPAGTLVVLQGRNNDPGAVNHFNSMKEFVNTYTLNNVLYSGTKQFKDPETIYDCYMVIGTR